MSVSLYEGVTGSPASGTTALLGLMASQQLAGRQVGAPHPVVTPKTAPAAPTSATSGTGITGTAVQHLIVAGYGTPMGSAHGPASVACAKLDLVNQGVAVAYTPDAAAAFHQLFRKYGDTGTASVTLADPTDLSDATWGGATYIGPRRARFEVKISTASGTDKFEWRKITLDQDTGAVVTTGAWSTEISITGASQTIGTEGVTITFGATTAHVLNDVFAVTYRCDWRHIWTNWDHTSTTFTDTTPIGSEDLDVPYEWFDTVAANYGALWQRMDTGTDFSRKDKPITPGELTGGSAPPRAIPGPVDFTHAMPVALRTSILIPTLASEVGIPTVTQTPGAPEWTYDFPLNPYTLSRDSLSIDALLYPGGDFRGKGFWGSKVGEIDGSFNLAKEALLKIKLDGTGDTECGFGIADTKTGTYAGACVTRGVRGDTNPFEDAVTVKVIDAPAAGTFTVVTKIASGSYSTYKSTIYYSTTTTKQIKGGRNQSEWVELLDVNGRPLGQNIGANRKPFSIFFPGVVTGLAANDTFVISALQAIPGIYTGANPTGPANDGSYAGQYRREALTPLFTATRVALYRGTTSADTFLECQGADIKLTRPLQPVRSLGPEAASPVDVDVLGKMVAQLDFDRRWISREFERVLKSDARYGVSLELDGAPIRTNPGVLGANESIVIGFKQARVETSAATISTDKVIPEKVSLVAEKPDDGSPFFSTLRIVSSTFFDFSAL